MRKLKPNPSSPSKKIFFFVSFSFFVFAAEIAKADAKDVKLDKITLPPGFSISIYA